MTKPTTREEQTLFNNFAEIRKLLLAERYRLRLQHPLALWTRSDDRHLPLAFLGRTLGDLLATPFHELASTPGIGPKKFDSLMTLLQRAAREEPPSISVDRGQARGDPAVVRELIFDGELDVSRVSELHWSKWRETVEHHGLAAERIGRVARCLREVPTVIWNRPLGYYLPFTLAEVRELKSHGNKRVRAVLEVFHQIHHLLGSVDSVGDFGVQVVPRLVARMEAWIQRALERDAAPTLGEVKHALAEAILLQIDLDVGPSMVELARGRIGVDSPPQSVRDLSRQMGINSVRVHELLDECRRLFEIRWPSGKLWLDGLTRRYEGHADEETTQLINSICTLLYPQNKQAPTRA